MTVHELTQAILSFVREHEPWAMPIVFVLAFGESLAFISLLLPATVILFAVGALIGESGIGFWPLWGAAALGAALGDWLSYWIGRAYKDEVAKVWPLSRYPDLLPRGHAFFARWGTAGIFIGRFFGPLRASVPLVAGICSMRALPFQLANASSALVWAAGVLAPGAFGLRFLESWF
jgi:membrane protein DedA with SNARE-associated domain